MTIYCSWCSELVTNKPPLQDQKIGHGICYRCKRNLESQIEDIKTPVGRPPKRLSLAAKNRKTEQRKHAFSNVPTGAELYAMGAISKDEINNLKKWKKKKRKA